MNFSNLSVRPVDESLILIKFPSSRIHLMVGVGYPSALHLILTEAPNFASTSPNDIF